MLKKMEMTKLNIEKNQNIFICPICYKDLHIDSFSLKCENSHCFDISKKGTLTLNRKNKLRNDKIYDIKLFENRIKFIHNGFYNHLHNIIAKIINEEKNISNILDMGVGDGTHDYLIYNKLNNKNIIFFGIDIVKTGINLSSNYIFNNFVPIVADLNNLPFKNHSIDIILNILSPSSEKEMSRVLKSEGIIIKVTPKKDYLKEIRQALNMKDYQNELIIEENIHKNYIVQKKYEINDFYSIDLENLNILKQMTPLLKYRNCDPIIDNITNITISLNIYVLKNKEK